MAFSSKKAYPTSTGLGSITPEMLKSIKHSLHSSNVIHKFMIDNNGKVQPWMSDSVPAVAQDLETPQNDGYVPEGGLYHPVGSKVKLGAVNYPGGPKSICHYHYNHLMGRVIGYSWDKYNEMHLAMVRLSPPLILGASTRIEVVAWDPSLLQLVPADELWDLLTGDDDDDDDGDDDDVDEDDIAKDDIPF